MNSWENKYLIRPSLILHPNFILDYNKSVNHNIIILSKDKRQTWCLHMHTLKRNSFLLSCVSFLEDIIRSVVVHVHALYFLLHHIGRHKTSVSLPFEILRLIS